MKKSLVLTVPVFSMMGGDSFGKVLILSFKDDEEHIINRILSCMNKEVEILHQGIVKEDNFINETFYHINLSYFYVSC